MKSTYYVIHTIVEKVTITSDTHNPMKEINRITTTNVDYIARNIKEIE